jgi:hypothetical protein
MKRKNVEKKGEGWNVEYSSIGNLIAATFIVILIVGGREVIS